MTFCFYFFFIILIITFQTVVFPSFFNSRYLYDFFIPLILYLGVYRRPIEGLTVILVSGMIAESLSAGPMGVLITSYFWIYSVIRWGRRFLYFGNKFFYPVIVAMGMAIQYFVLAIAFLMMGGKIYILESVGSISVQFACGVITGPISIALIRTSHIVWKSWFKKPLGAQDS